LISAATETEASGSRNRFAEKFRTQIADWRAAIRAVKQVADLR